MIVFALFLFLVFMIWVLNAVNHSPWAHRRDEITRARRGEQHRVNMQAIEGVTWIAKVQQEKIDRGVSVGVYTGHHRN